MKTSAAPTKKYCGNNQNTLISDGLELSRLFFSTKAAEVRAKIETNKPTPIRCNDVMPWRWPVCLERIGTINFSWMGTRMTALMALKTLTEPTGIVKLEESFRSMMEAWLMKKVASWAKEMDRVIVDAHMGRTLIRDLNSSTCVTVQSFHRFFVLASGSVATAALSKNLHQ